MTFSKPRSVPASDLEGRSLGTGDPRSADRSAGKQQNAVWASISLDGGGSTPGTVKEYDVPHNLGKKPTVVQLGPYENARGAVTITARGVREENWSHSHVHVEVTLIAGSLDGCRASFLVRGR